mmetsp:Transcript_9171/g.21739  ORF Transcript_9171/g.21739 Transcript_9171/m.21739 type:complete len:419 (-) Transcript_9171:289-1545(-)
MAVASSASKTALEDMESPLACPVCLDLPSGEVHQCLEGHCMCVDCWNRLDPRRCPECRDWLPPKNRNWDREARVAALAAACEHCGMITTRGAVAEHLRACHLCPAICTAAVAGCGWEGMAAEEAAHESACPLAQTRARAAHEACPLAQNGLLQPLAGQVRAFDGDEEGERRRQRLLGPATHDAPPSDATVAVMGMAEATAALRKHLTVARVAEKACKRIRLLSKGMIKGESLPESLRLLPRQGLDAVVEAMREHPQVAKVQEEGCNALRYLAIRLGQESATEAGAVEAAVDAMRLHPHVTQVLLRGFDALFRLSFGYDAAVRVAEADALQLVVAAMRTHPQVAEVQERGVQALFSWRGLLCRAPYGHRITQVGGRDVLSAAMQAFPANQDHQRFCAARLLDILAASSSASSASAAQCS